MSPEANSEHFRSIESRSLFAHESKCICHNFEHFKMSIGVAYFLRCNFIARYICPTREWKREKSETIISAICRCPKWLYSVPTKLQLMNKRVHCEKNNAMIAPATQRATAQWLVNATAKATPKETNEWECCACFVCAACELSMFSGVGRDYSSNNGKTSYYLIHHLKIISK